MKKCTTISIAMFLCVVLLSANGLAATVTKLNDIRAGRHKGYTRLVLYAEGARPLKIGPATAEGVTIVYEQLELVRKPSVLFRDMIGAAANVSHHRQADRSVIAITFKNPNTAVRSFYMGGESAQKGAYRLIIDLYPAGSAAAGPGALVPVASAKAAIPAPTPGPAPAAAPSPQAAAEAIETPLPAAESSQQPETSEDKETSPEETQVSATGTELKKASAPEEFLGKLSGELGIIGRLRNDDAKDSLYTQYRDPETVSGDFHVKYEQEDRYFFRADGKNLGQDDVNLTFRGGWYGKMKGSISYDEIPHRFAFDVKTLYSGVGSDVLTLDNALQSKLQELSGHSAAQADVLKNEFSKAASGDPEIKRKKLSGDLELMALDPFSIRGEFSCEEQDGTRPFFGSFLGDTMEIFEPIDNETRSLKLIAEYAKKSYLLNATYYYQHFNNNENTLTFDNPFRLDDAVGKPSKGQIDLAPDNHYQNISISGSYMDLPFNTRISTNAAWGWMRQDDDLPPFTTNTTLTSPINYSDRSSLPESKADVKVNTSLYNVTLNARPLNFMRVQGIFRHYDYDNKTDKVEFPNGYVLTDAFPSTPQLGVPISTLPTSYKKTKAKVNLGFDVWTKTRLNLDYTYKLTKRDNREVDKQTDNIFGGSIDTNPFHWVDLRASYYRTDTDIDDYDFEVYLESGQDLQQLPGLRKYTQADVVRDRFQFMGNVYPIEPLAFSGSFTYGNDDFHDSTFGLTDADYYSFSVDGDYTLTDRLSLNAFYIYEKYKNKQKGRGEFDEDGDGVSTVTDWRADGEDRVDTFGCAVTYAVIPGRLDFNLSYSYSKVDGKIDFSIPNGSVTDFDTVDDSTLQTLDAKLKYNIWGGCFVTLGYVWEKFDYDDYNKEGFTFVPTDAAGNFNGAVLADTLWEDYDAHIIYTKFTYFFR
jgi:MtrB/PioB family decaheme-associated outer membrane protein